MPSIHTRIDTPNRRLGAILTLALLALGGGGATAWAAPQATPATPLQTAPPAQDAVQPGAVAPMEVAEPVHDFGKMVKGESGSHTFVLRNSGDEPLRVAGIKPSCGCTVAEFDRVIPPGGEGNVTAVLDTMTVTGKVSSALEVFVEGHQTAMATLELRAEVVPKLLAHPGYARWIYVQHEEEGTISNTLVSVDGAEFDVLSVEAPMPAIDVSFRPATPEERTEKATGSQWRLDATLDSQAPVGAISGYLTVHTNHPQQKEMRIPVSGFVRPALFIEPPERDFGTVQLTSRRYATFEVRNFATDPINLTGAESDIPGVSAELKSIEDGRRYNLLVVFDPETMKEGDFAGEVRVTTDSEEVPAVSVDLKGKVVRPSSDGEGT